MQLLNKLESRIVKVEHRKYGLVWYVEVKTANKVFKRSAIEVAVLIRDDHRELRHLSECDVKKVQVESNLQ